MYEAKFKTKIIDLNVEKDLKAYDEILNDPSCSIIREVQEKISNKIMGDEGAVVSVEEKLLRIVTYQKKEMME